MKVKAFKPYLTEIQLLSLLKILKNTINKIATQQKCLLVYCYLFIFVNSSVDKDHNKSLPLLKLYSVHKKLALALGALG